MTPNASLLTYPLGELRPPAGTCHRVAGDTPDAVYWLRMPLPFALNHINLWLLRDRLDGQEGWTVVDCGVATDDTRNAWEQIFSTQLDGLPILRVVVTHMHPDHVGLANWLCERWSTQTHDCRLWMSAADYYAARLASQSTTGPGGEAAARFFAAHGLQDPVAQEQIRARSGYYPRLVPTVPRQYSRLRDGQAVCIGGHLWRCIAGWGHAPEHMALYCEARQLLISGDMVLPRISTNVSVYDTEPEANPLPAFLASVDRFRELPDATLVLPSHGEPFVGLHSRIQQLHDHHRDRLAEVLQACAQAPQTAAALLPVLFKRPLDLHQTTFAMGEAIAHLHALWHAGRLQRQPSASGVWMFAATSPKALRA